MPKQSYETPPNDARRTHFLVGRNKDHLERQIQGCPWSSTLIADSATYGLPIIIALGCKRWGCTHCGPIRTAQLARNVQRAAPTKFITLTTDSKLWKNGRQAFDAIRRKLPTLTKQLRKEHQTFEYVRILELHKNGMPHWHLLARCPYIPQNTLSNKWRQLTGSPIVDIRAATNGPHAARYVMKYLTKCKYIEWTNRRVSWSKNFFPPQPPTEKENWHLTNKTYEKESPETVMQTQFFGHTAKRCGPYAWTMAPNRPLQRPSTPDDSSDVQ